MDSSPLKPDDCTTLNKVLGDCAKTSELIRKCKDCGLPVEEYESINNQQAEMAAALKKHFFPHNP